MGAHHLGPQPEDIIWPVLKQASELVQQLPQRGAQVPAGGEPRILDVYERVLARRRGGDR